MNTDPLFQPNATEYTTPKITAIAGGRSSSQETDSGFDLNEQLVRNKPATFFMRVNSDAMKGAGIHNGDVIIVDRSLPAKNGKVVVAVLNGEMLVRRYERSFNKIRLVPETTKLASIDIDPLSQFSIWGVVTYVIHEL
ncbi:MAG: translesion error-prone DNA polymerase V autoproteolytic subunit [Chitinophagaceae bacterium]